MKARKNGKRPPPKSNGDHRPAGKTTALTTGNLIPQDHGGALRNGGTNKGGPGRPASEIRKRLRGSFDKRIPILEKIADKARGMGANGDKTRAMDLMGKYGLGTERTITIVGDEDIVHALLWMEEVVRDVAPPALANTIIERFNQGLT